jgi:predicted nucleic acid-binding protein
LKVFIDSNIPMYVAGREHPHREPAMRFLEHVKAGTVEGCTSTEVLQEILYRYTALGKRDLAREVYTLFVDICPVVLSVDLADTDLACELVCEVPGISARDAIHAAVMRNHDLQSIATFDEDFDRIGGIRRVRLT